MFYFGASVDPYPERSEALQVAKGYKSDLVLTSVSTPSADCETPQSNTDKSVEFSEAYANYMANKIIELQYN